jgi:glycosyltransferase involved in cell wall biosynthesis
VRILHTISVRWWNACAYYAITLARTQSRQGHDVFVAGVADYLSTDIAKRENLNVVRINFSTKDPFKWLTERSILSRFIKQNRIQIINCHTAEDHLMAGRLAQRHQIPLVRTVGDVRIPNRNLFNSRLFYRLTTQFIFSSEANYTRYFSLWPYIQDKSNVIHGGVDLEIFARKAKDPAILEKLCLPKDKLLVGIIGRFSKIKDHHTFLRAAKLSRYRIENLHFIISGADAGYKQVDILRMIQNLNMQSAVMLTGPFDPITDLIALLDIGVVASKDSEAICRIAMEYMAMGVPMVVTDINVLPEIVQDSRNGFVVLAEDPYEMSECIIRLAESIDLRKKISQANILDATDRYSLDQWYHKTETVYRKVIKHKKNHST